MTLALYILDVPEFEPVVAAARAAGMTDHRTGDYLRLTSEEHEVRLHREGTGIRTAVWHAALTGGIDATILAYSPDVLHLGPAPA